MRAFVTAVLSASLLVGIPAPAHALWPHDPTVNVAVSTSSLSENPVMLPDGSGGAFIAWHDSRGTAFYDIYVQHVLASGIPDPAWPVNGVAVCTAVDHQMFPRMVPDGLGGAIIVWQDFRSGIAYDIYAHHLLSTGALDPAWPVDGRALCTAADDQSDHTIVSDAAGGAIVAWMDLRGGSTYDVYAQHVLASGAVDPSWPANGRALCVALNDQWYPAAVSDGAGGAIVAWQDGRSAGINDIYAMRVLASGAVAPGWPINGRVVCNATGEQANAKIVPDASGGAIVAWMDQRSGLYKAYAQHVSSSGVIDAGWPANGRALCAAAGTQEAVEAVSDGGSGAIIAWSDTRSGEPHIYAHHVSVAGTLDPAWPADGRALCTASGGQGAPQLVADGSSGAFVTWGDGRNGAYLDVYAGHVLSTGAVDPFWPANGRAVSTAAGVQQSAALVIDPLGGVILAWSDGRSGVSQIYAQRVDRWGSLGGVEPRIVSVKDVPNDQGGKVKLSWDASYLDPLADPNVTGYDILRSVPASLAVTLRQAGARTVRLSGEGTAPRPGDLVADPAGTNAYYWEFLTSTPALHYISAYSYVASTLSDSLAGSNPKTVFMVVAHNSGSTMYWLSAPDSGYSVDNLGPASPNAFSGEYAGGTTRLHWAPNAEVDLANYRLYRGADGSFVPGPGNLIASPPDTGYTDATAGSYVYKLSAVDVHGNESPVVTVTPSGTVGVGDPVGHVLSFAAPSPNPATATVAFRFELPAAGPARLALYDATGRLVRELVNADHPAGEHAAAWDLRDGSGRAVAPGLYFARFEAGGKRFARRLAVTR